MSSLAMDALIIGLIYAVAATTLTLAYKRSGRVWILRHSLILAGSNGRTYRSGRDGELVIVTLAAISALVVTYFTPDVSIVGVVAKWPWQCLAALVFVFVVIRFYSRSVIRHACDEGRKPVYCDRLRRAYDVYDVYSTCLFGVGAIILMMLLFQFLLDGAAFSAEAQALNATFEQAGRIAAEGVGLPLDQLHAVHERAQAQAEVGYGGVAMANKLLQNQFNPLFIFAGVLISINMVINYTPLRSLFMKGATVMTVIFTYAPLITIAAIALLIYLSVYDAMLATALNHLQTMTPPVALADWELSQRHAEMSAGLAEARNLFGFAKSVAGGGGGFAALVWGLEFALDKVAEKREGEKDPALVAPPRLPKRKYRPHAA